jgi:hypothetical protein
MLPGCKSGLPMRGWGWKVAYRCTAELNRLDQWKVAGDAGGVGCLEVRGLKSVARETAGDHCEAHLHRIRTWCYVAGSTGEHGIGRRLGYELRMLQVSKPQIARPGAVGCIPLHRALDRAVVTLLAVSWGGPQGLGWIGCAGVTPCATGKDLPVLPVVEVVLSHPGPRASRCGDCPADHHCGQDSVQFHRTPAGGIRGEAGGRGTTSAWLRSTRVARAVRRVWFQSMAAASGRLRASQ